jgi:hypothetical protein
LDKSHAEKKECVMAALYSLKFMLPKRRNLGAPNGKKTKETKRKQKTKNSKKTKKNQTAKEKKTQGSKRKKKKPRKQKKRKNGVWSSVP